MGRSNRFAEMNEVYMHMKTARKEQPAIRLWHMGSGPNDCRRQPIPRFVEAEDKFIAETRQHMEEQFVALEDQLETSPTQISNMGGHKGNGSRNPFAERRTQGHQHHAQAHATRWVDGFKLNIPKFQRDLQPEELMDQVAAVREVLDFKKVPEDRQVSLVTTKLIDEDLSVHWASPPIYDIYPDEEDLLEEVNLVIDTINIVEGNDVHLVSEESPKSEISQWGLEKINYVDFLGIKTFLSTPPKQKLDIGVGMVEEIGVNNFKYNTRSYVMKVCKLFMFRYQFGLMLRSTGWNGLVGHPKDRGKNWQNSWTNSLQQGENDVG
jgi:hypothetical protein